jgi:hypothetical protein
LSLADNLILKEDGSFRRVQTCIKSGKFYKVKPCFAEKFCPNEYSREKYICTPTTACKKNIFEKGQVGSNELMEYGAGGEYAIAELTISSKRVAILEREDKRNKRNEYIVFDANASSAPLAYKGTDKRIGNVVQKLNDKISSCP